jgi:hypothetical protein
MFAVMKTFVADISASTGRNDFIFDIWLWHGDLYCVSPFQAYCTSTSCLPCDLEFFMFAIMKIFVTDISASTGRNDFIFDYAIISPYFDGRIKMNGPYPEITNISFLAKLFFKTFISLKHLSDYRTVG